MMEPKLEPTKRKMQRPKRSIGAMRRRELLKMTPLLAMGALAVPSVRDNLLDQGLRFADWVSLKTALPNRLAPTYAASQLTPFEQFPYNSYLVDEPEIDLDGWTLTVEGAVQRPGEYTLRQIQDLPKVTQNTRHVCIEGWDAVGSFGGARISDFLRLVGADPGSRYLEATCWDDYYTTYDMAGCLHPQSLLCYEMYGRPLDRGHGAPLRVLMPTKLGYKSAKYLLSLRVTNVLGKERGYWEDQGYSWHGGI